MMIYEERQTIVEPDKVSEFLTLGRESRWPRYNSHGGQVVSFLSGLIGAPQNEFLQVAAYPDFASWESAQDGGEDAAGAIVRSEKTRLLRPISSRPKVSIPREDYRNVYGHRRFLIDPSDLDEFVHCSENGIWPRIESQGACILGLWTTVAAEYPAEITLITGYHSPSHWEETRFEGAAPEGVDPSLWNKEDPLRQRRVELSLNSWVRLMQAHDVW